MRMMVRVDLRVVRVDRVMGISGEGRVHRLRHHRVMMGVGHMVRIGRWVRHMMRVDHRVRIDGRVDNRGNWKLGPCGRAHRGSRSRNHYSQKMLHGALPLLNLSVPCVNETLMRLFPLIER